jgi:NAD(P)-dependent dehydrogenase (short-subunit alcohol dehydrogenase family)
MQSRDAGQILLRLGGIHVLWTNYETTLELIAKQLLHLTPRQAQIVFASIANQAKRNIVVALLKEDGDNTELVNAIHNVAEVAKRNHLTHSYIFEGPDHAHFLKVDVKNGYRARSLRFSLAEIDALVQEFREALELVEQLADIDPKVRDGYLSELLASEKTDKS